MRLANTILGTILSTVLVMAVLALLFGTSTPGYLPLVLVAATAASFALDLYLLRRTP